MTKGESLEYRKILGLINEITRENLTLREMLRRVWPDDWPHRLAEASTDATIQNLVTTQMAQAYENERRLDRILR
jgi:hypothetical protein